MMMFWYAARHPSRGSCSPPEARRCSTRGHFFWWASQPSLAGCVFKGHGSRGGRKLCLPMVGYNRPRGEASRCYPATTCMDDEQKRGGGDVLPAELPGSWDVTWELSSSRKCRWRGCSNDQIDGRIPQQTLAPLDVAGVVAPADKLRVEGGPGTVYL